MNPDFSDMLSALSDEGAEYLLVGAYAMAVLLGRDDLIKNKLATGRDRDRADAEQLRGKGTS
jgi:hypothetical protein